MIDLYYLKSECLNGYLHNYKQLAFYPWGITEMCEKCKDIQFFKIANGRVDNLNYIDYHQRQCLPKYHPLFKNEYSKK